MIVVVLDKGGVGRAKASVIPDEPVIPDVGDVLQGLVVDVGYVERVGLNGGFHQ
jgi:hypothetical protein